MSSPPNSPHKPKKKDSTGEGTGRYNHPRLPPVDSNSGPNNPGTKLKATKRETNPEKKAKDAAKRRKYLEEQDKNNRKQIQKRINTNQERAEKNKNVKNLIKKMMQ